MNTKQQHAQIVVAASDCFNRNWQEVSTCRHYPQVSIEFQNEGQESKENLTLGTTKSPLYIVWRCKCHCKTHIRVQRLRIRGNRNCRVRFTIRENVGETLPFRFERVSLLLRAPASQGRKGCVASKMTQILDLCCFGLGLCKWIRNICSVQTNNFKS